MGPSNEPGIAFGESRSGEGGGEAAEPPSCPNAGGASGGATGRGELRLEWIDLRRTGSAAAALRLDLDAVAGRLAAAPLGLPPAVQEVRLALLDDAAMASLHREHCGLDSTTDVLSYPDLESAGAAGDVAIGIEVAAREAARLGRRLEEEVLLYAVHGLLHLGGERDDTAAAAARMRQRQDAVLAAIGAPPTDPPAAAAEPSA